MERANKNMMAADEQIQAHAKRTIEEQKKRGCNGRSRFSFFGDSSHSAWNRS